MSDQTIECHCGQVAMTLTGKAIASVACHCDDCQEGSRQLEGLPGAVPILDDAGGTEYVLFRRDRMHIVRGHELLQNKKIRQDSATNRVVASCCNAAMMVTFDDVRHWSPVYRARLGEGAPALEWRICTKFKPEGARIAQDVPGFSMYPAGFMVRLAASGLGALLRW